MKDIVSHYAWIGVGIVIGAMAHFGRIIMQEGLPSWRMVAGYILQLGLVGLVAAVATEKMNLAGLDATLTSAIMAISTNEVFNFIRRRGKMLLEQDS